MSEWSHLPNAAHIDWIIQDVEPNPSDWVAAWWAARDIARDTAYEAACGAAWFAARDTVWDAARDTVEVAALDTTWDAACNAALALIAYDHAGALFDRPLDQVRVQAYLGQPAAILLLPACEVRAMRDLG